MPQYTPNPAFQFDYFVIGAGSGGVRSARIAASHGARVAIAEDTHFGGTCVNIGCVPKKLFSYAAHFSHDFHDATGYGWNFPTQPTFDWQTLLSNKNTEITRLNGIYRKILNTSGVEIVEGRASLKDAHTVTVAGVDYTAQHILLATGGEPWLPDEEGVRTHAATSDDMFYLEHLPRKMLVAGGGYIALEFASILKGLGVDVTLIYRGERFMRGFDEELRAFMDEEFDKQGIPRIYNQTITKLEQKAGGEGYLAHLSKGEVFEADLVLYAVGRRPRIAGLNFEAVGVKINQNGAVQVNDSYQTSIPNIYAVGDVTDRVNLTPVAIAEGHWLADTLFGGLTKQGKARQGVAYPLIPTAMFCTPPVATVGLTEEAALATGHSVIIFQTTFRAMLHTLGGRQEKTFMKLVVDSKTDKVLGVHLAGKDTPEMIQGLAVALTAGATKADFDRTIPLHPSSAEEFVTLRTAVR